MKMTTTRTICWTTLAGLMMVLSPAVARPSQEPVPKAAAAQDAPALKDGKEKTSYAVGMNLGSAIRKDADLDVNVIVQGLKDAFTGGKMLLTDAEMRNVLNQLATDLKTKQVAALRERGSKAKSEGEAFLAGNKATEGVVSLESGLQYKIVKAGDGKKPTADDTVVCHYRGTLVDGTEFDSSYKRNKPATFQMNRVIKGWTEALQLMPVGSKWQLFIPSGLAYGERGAGASVPPNATLIFEVELVSIQAASEGNSAASKTTGARAQGSQDKSVGATARALGAINISVKRDPRISKGLYMGDRWLELPYTQVGQGKQVTVEARAEGLADEGKPVRIAPQWIPADPEMITVTPSQGKEVTITVLRPGESSIEVSSQGVSRQLGVKADYTGETLQVRISQK